MSNDIEERRIRELQRVAFFAWVRFVVTLATSLLAVSVSFQKSYLPPNPVHPLLLRLSWCLFLLSILAGVFRAAGDFHEYQKHLDWTPPFRRHGMPSHPVVAATPPLQPKIGPNRFLFWSFYVMWSAFLGALVLLVIFAMENIRP